MDTIAGYVATGIVSLTVGILTRYIEPKAKLIYWLPHSFFFHLQNENVNLQTNSLTIQNVGRKPAEGVEIVHKARPDFFQFSPSVAFTESSTPTGEFVIAVPHLGPKEFFTLQLLSYKTVPYLLNVRSKEGPATQIPITVQRIYPRWFNLLAAGLMLVGLGFVLYWLIVTSVYVYVHLRFSGTA